MKAEKEQSNIVIYNIVKDRIHTITGVEGDKF